MRSIAALLLLSSTAWGQAEPAPPGYKPPPRAGAPEEEEPPPQVRDLGKQPKWHIAVAPHLAIALGELPSTLGRVGYGGGVQIARALVALGRGRFGIAGDFAYDKISTDHTEGTQSVAHAAFAALLVVDGIAGRVRPWIGLGGGFSVAQYEDPRPSTLMPRGVSDVSVVGLVKLSAGFGVRVYESFAVGLRADTNLTFSSQTRGTPPREIYAPGLFTLGLDLGFRF